MYAKLKDDVVKSILFCIDQHPDWSYQMVARVIGVSESSVQRIAREAGIVRREPRKKPNADFEKLAKQTHKGIEAWLKKNWHWKMPDKQPQYPKVRERSFWKTEDLPGQHSEFRTPYNYPRKWHQGEENQYIY
jgi:hypothetical protein